MAGNDDTKTLAELREAYKREDYHEDGAFSHDDMNAFHRAARALIAALEVQNAEQQRRIDALEKGLGQIVYVSTPYTSVRKIAHALLCADEKGGEG